MTVRWAIAGTGKMAATFAEDFARVDQAELVAVASRATASAQRFGEPFGARGLNYDALWAADDVDAVYIATPHTHHAEIALAAVEAGKAVLVEKSFTASSADTRRVVDAARARGVFAMEAMWTRFLPGAAELQRLIAQGEIGQVRSVQGDLMAFRAFDPSDRLFDPAQGGGAILDLGVYVVSFAQWLLGRPDRVVATGGLLPNGVEGEAAIQLGYADGRFASLGCGFTSFGPGRMAITGTAGWVDVHPRFHRISSMTVHHGKESTREIELPYVGHGYAHELAHASDCISQGLTESPVMTLDDTLAVQETLDAALAQVRG